jgi:GT2 family glycosyltransferase
MSKRHNKKPQVVYKSAPSAMLDIIIPVYGRFDLLEKCLDCIPKSSNTVTYNIIVIDNASDQKEADEFYSKRNDIILIRNKENVGFPRACNQGARRKTSPFIFFLNSDVLLEPNSIELLMSEFTKDETLGITGMLLVFPETSDLNLAIRPPKKVQHVGMATNIHGKWIHQFIGWSDDNPKVLAQRNVYAVTGAALMTRRTLWNKIGGFYEGYGLGTFEDVDYCMSVRELGYNVIVVPEAKGIHYTGATAEKYKIPYALDNNRMIFLQRWKEKLMWSEWEHY